MNTAKCLRRVAGFLAVAFNLFAGTLNLVAAHKTHNPANYFAVCVSLAAVIFIIALNIKAEFQLRQFQREFAQFEEETQRLEEETQRLMGIAIEVEMSAKIQAKKNLEKVLSALHATRLGPCGYNGTDMYEFSIGKIKFQVDQYYIYWNFEGTSRTCYNIGGGMPVEEQIASAILLLSRNPDLYVHWSSSPGNYYS